MDCGGIELQPNDMLIEMRGITKHFGSVVANENVNLTVRRGEILSVLGENGSGKTSLMNMLAGIYFPDAGHIYMNGREVVIRSPKDAFALGIGMIHQHFKLVEVLTAAENIILGLPGPLKLDMKKVTKEIRELADKYGFELDPDRKIYEMSVSQKQTVEIVKMLYRGANVLILDEPTAVLTPQETEKLFQVLRNMRAQGHSILIITHKLNEVLSLSDRVAVLRKGESIGTVDTKDATERSLTEMMVGKKVDLDIERPDPVDPIMKLKLTNVNAVDHEGRPVLSNVEFEAYTGEILGIAGIAGSGQKELCEIIAGMQRASSGEIVFQGESILGKPPAEIIRRGIQMSFIPEDRLGMGLVAGMDIVENVMLKTFRRGKTPFIDRSSGRRDAERIVRDYSIDTPSVGHIVKKLSGGNIQKVLLGREIDLNPTLLITAYPVRGLDIGASYFIYDALNKQKEKGVGILFIGEDLDVLMELCDRVMVIHGGAVMGIVDPAQVTKEDIGLMMLGHKPGEVVA